LQTSRTTACWSPRFLKSQIAQPGMPIRTRSQRPGTRTSRLVDGKVVDACMPCVHPAVFIELPVLIAIRTEPVSGVIVQLVSEPRCDCRVGPDLLDRRDALATRPPSLSAITSSYSQSHSGAPSR
jgi:hypothetical protein